MWRLEFSFDNMTSELPTWPSDLITPNIFTFESHILNLYIKPILNLKTIPILHLYIRPVLRLYVTPLLYLYDTPILKLYFTPIFNLYITPILNLYIWLILNLYFRPIMNLKIIPILKLYVISVLNLYITPILNLYIRPILNLYVTPNLNCISHQYWTFVSHQSCTCISHQCLVLWPGVWPTQLNPLNAGLILMSLFINCVGRPGVVESPRWKTEINNITIFCIFMYIRWCIFRKAKQTLPHAKIVHLISQQSLAQELSTKIHIFYKTAACSHHCPLRHEYHHWGIGSALPLTTGSQQSFKRVSPSSTLV